MVEVDIVGVFGVAEKQTSPKSFTDIQVMDPIFRIEILFTLLVIVEM